MNKTKKYTSYACIVTAAVLWGTTSIFVSKLSEYGLSSMQIVFVRALTAAIILSLYLFITDKKLLKINLHDLPIFLGTGIISFTFFSYCYFNAMKLCSVSVAAVLLYTAPAFVMIMSAVLFKEKLTPVKIGALIVTMLGCVLVTGAFGKSNAISTIGILFGLGAGIGYALYSIFGRYGIDKYHSLTVTAYTFIVATFASLPFCIIDGFASVTISPQSIAWMIGVGIFTSTLPYILYTKGLANVESGTASVIATIEPVVAAVVGYFVFDEAMTFEKTFGIGLIFLAVAMVNIKKKS